MRISPQSPLSFLRHLSRRRHRCFLPSPLTVTHHQPLLRSLHHVNSFSHSVERLPCASHSSSETQKIWDLWNCSELPEEALEFESGDELSIRHLIDEEEPPESRKTRLEWLCKQLPTLRSVDMVRLLNYQKNWITQDDSAYLVSHCTGIRQNEAAFQVYKWMMQQNWYRFDFNLATKVANYLGKERKFVKCRDIFDDIINQRHVPEESTFHILVIAYLGASVEGCLEEACAVYNRMIQLRGCKPQLSLHIFLFRALVAAKPASKSYYLKQAEQIYCNLLRTGLEIPKDVYTGLIRLHSCQDVIDKERIMKLREEMKDLGMEEGKDVLLSILRACSTLGDVEEAEKAWLELITGFEHVPSQAFVYRMQTFAAVGESMKSMETFRRMQEHFGGSATLSAYQKIIEVMSDAQNVELAELVMEELTETGLKPLTPSYAALMKMYLNLNMHEKVESIFRLCSPNRAIYNLYLSSLVKVGNFSKAEQIFSHMQGNEATIGVDSASCNAVLSGWLESGDHVKAEKVYDLMCKKRYDIESSSMQKLEYFLSLSRKDIKRPVSLKLSFEQREALVGLLLGGLVIESDGSRQSQNHYMIRFEFDENTPKHSVLRQHLYLEYREWLHPSCNDGNVPYKFATVSDTYFGFYADQFWPRGRPVIPKLIHRWMSPRALAYWYMYGGRRSQSGDIWVKLGIDSEDEESVPKVVKALGKRSLECEVRKKDGVFWIGLLGSNAIWFWKLVEPFILDGLQDLHSAETRDVSFLVYGDESRELQ
ncbi:Pentatricopeptide repeat-containing protein At2g15820, chloroplastic [Linum grandiflorum]